MHVDKQEMIADFITGKQIPLIGSEENRQAVCRFLVEKKGFKKLLSWSAEKKQRIFTREF